jgi:hypothetical protein
VRRNHASRVLYLTLPQSGRLRGALIWCLIEIIGLFRLGSAAQKISRAMSELADEGSNRG